MPGSNFDSPLKINKLGCVDPTGPLSLAPGEKPVRLDIWVWQDGGACVACQRAFRPGRKWKATPIPKEDHTGAMFKPGPATAMAILVSKKAGKTKTYQWVEGILLRK
jgi:hypothetical protein